MEDIIRLGALFLISFGSGMIDLSLGMGFGFTVTPLMLLLGFNPMEAVPCVLFSSFVGGVSSSFFNHRMHNVDFSWNTRASRVSLYTAAIGIFGSIGGVQMSINLPQRIVGLYIGFIVIASGALVLASRDLISDFSWIKMSIISLIGSINKGLTGSVIVWSLTVFRCWIISSSIWCPRLLNSSQFSGSRVSSLIIFLHHYVSTLINR